MTSKLQNASNGRNAKLSTGPSEESKSRTRLNSLKHGLRAAPGRVLPGECPEELEALHQQGDACTAADAELGQAVRQRRGALVQGGGRQALLPPVAAASAVRDRASMARWDATFHGGHEPVSGCVMGR